MAVQTTSKIVANNGYGYRPKVECVARVEQTKAGLWYAVCTCGKRSRFFVGKVTAEDVAEKHVK